jgi:F-type H+-transporting ATPase subunit a
MAKDDPLSVEHLMEHVKDAEYFHLPRIFRPETGGKVFIPQWRESSEPIVQIRVGAAMVDELIEPLDGQVTKFMVLEVVGCLILLVTFLPLAWRARRGAAPRGRIWNLLESMVVFIRNQVARPTIGAHDGDRYTPFLLTMFFFVLVCNLLGLVPWCGSPTGALATTGALAVITFGVVVVAGSRAMGPVGFWLGQVPQMDIAPLMRVPLWLLIFGIEVVGLVIKHSVLAMRLMANMMAGHVVLAVLSAFVAAAGSMLVLLGVIPASLLGSVAVGLLELFVAFLQAYIFTFLSGLFIGMAVHPH